MSEAHTEICMMQRERIPDERMHNLVGALASSTVTDRLDSDLPTRFASFLKPNCLTARSMLHLHAESRRVSSQPWSSLAKNLSMWGFPLTRAPKSKSSFHTRTSGEGEMYSINGSVKTRWCGSGLSRLYKRCGQPDMCCWCRYTMHPAAYLLPIPASFCSSLRVLSRQVER